MVAMTILLSRFNSEIADDLFLGSIDDSTKCTVEVLTGYKYDLVIAVNQLNAVRSVIGPILKRNSFSDTQRYTPFNYASSCRR